MSRTIDVRAAEGVLYGIYKALYKMAGDSAPSVMRQAAPDILEELGKLGVDFNCVDNVQKLENKLGETLVSTGMCDKMEFKMDGNELTANITNCAFADLTKNLGEQGIPPFGCPFAALTIALSEKNLGKKARLKKLEPVPGGKPGDTVMIVELQEK
jgi:hypothetical protein